MNKLNKMPLALLSSAILLAGCSKGPPDVVVLHGNLAGDRCRGTGRSGKPLHFNPTRLCGTQFIFISQVMADKFQKRFTKLSS